MPLQFEKLSPTCGPSLIVTGPSVNLPRNEILWVPCKLMLLCNWWSPGRKIKMVLEQKCHFESFAYWSNVHGLLTVQEIESLDGCIYFTCGVRLPTGWLEVVNVSANTRVTIASILSCCLKQVWISCICSFQSVHRRCKLHLKKHSNKMEKEHSMEN